MSEDCYYVVRFVSWDREGNKIMGFLDGDMRIAELYCSAWLFSDYDLAARHARNHNYCLPHNQAADVCKVPLPEFVHTVDCS